MADRIRVDAAVGAGRRLLHPHRRQMKELVDDPRGHRLDRRRSVSESPRRARRPLELGRPDLLGPGAQRRDRRHDVARGLPGAEALRLVGDDRLGARRLAPPAGEARPRRPTRGRRCRRGSSRRARGSRGRGRAGRRCRSGRAAAPCGERSAASTSARAKRAARGAGRRDDHVDLAELAPAALERDRPGRRSGRRARRAWSGERLATNAIRAPRAARLRAASSATCPAPTSSTRQPVEIAEHLLGERRGRRGDGRRALARSPSRARTFLPAWSACRKSRSSTGPVVPASNARAHLAEDLALTRHHRVEAGRDPEEVDARPPRRVAGTTDRAQLLLGQPAERCQRARARAPLGASSPTR